MPYKNKSAVTNLGFIKAKTLEKNPNAKTMEVDGEKFPIQMKGLPAPLMKKCGSYRHSRK
jgi:hypothetical protein